MQSGEENAVNDLILRVFNAFVAPNYSAQGIQEFYAYVQPQALAWRARENHFILVAIVQDQQAGMVEVRYHEHISLLFVDKAFQQQGVARALLNKTLEICRKHRLRLGKLSVNASPYALPIYEKFGFRPAEPEGEIHGIRFIPMELELK
jgi:GNAT superfamily N-acetyltransferase